MIFIKMAVLILISGLVSIVQAYQDSEPRFNAQNIDRTLKELRAAATNNNLDAQITLFFLFSEGTVVPKNEKEAFKWLKPAAMEVPELQTYLADRYQEGIGTSKNYALALKWYRSAAKLSESNGSALYQLGKMHELGLGIPSNYPAAIDFYERASLYIFDKVADANLRLANLYYQGVGTVKDLVTAYALLRIIHDFNPEENVLSSEPWFFEKNSLFKKIQAEMTSEQQSQGELLAEQLQKFIDDPHPYALASTYLQIGNPYQARRWYVAAALDANDTNEPIDYQLAKLYQTGAGVKKNPILALALIEKFIQTSKTLELKESATEMQNNLRSSLSTAEISKANILRQKLSKNIHQYQQLLL